MDYLSLFYISWPIFWSFQNLKQMSYSLIANSIISKIQGGYLTRILFDNSSQFLNKVDSNIAIDDVNLSIDAFLFAYFLESLILITIL